MTELLKAVRERNTELARHLLEQGADPNGADPETGGRLLHSAIEFSASSGDMAKLLIEYGANVNAVNPHYGTTPLMYAARSNIPALIALLEKNVDLDKKDKAGRTALEWAKTASQTKAVKMLKAAAQKQFNEAEQKRLLVLHETAAKRQTRLKNIRTARLP